MGKDEREEAPQIDEKRIPTYVRREAAGTNGKTGNYGYCTSQEKVDTSGTYISHLPSFLSTMAGSFGFQYLSLYWTGVR